VELVEIMCKQVAYCLIAHLDDTITEVAATWINLLWNRDLNNCVAQSIVRHSQQWKVDGIQLSWASKQ
jgi:hypothetical protein